MSQPGAEGPLRLLVADDEALARRRVTQLLRGRSGIEVAGETAIGPATVAAVRELAPDLLLLDVQMPGLVHALFRGVDHLSGDRRVATGIYRSRARTGPMPTRPDEHR